MRGSAAGSIFKERDRVLGIYEGRDRGKVAKAEARELYIRAIVCK